MHRTMIITPSRCTACRTCELACSFKHTDGKTPGLSRIRAFMKTEGRNMILTCFQCDDALCVKACPVQALVRNEETGSIEVLDRRCIKCGACAGACPFGHIENDKKSEIAIKCDLCGGDPACAAFCPTKTLEYI